jgi:hypothetical protein
LVPTTIDASLVTAYRGSMPIDVDAAEQFVFANARLLDRHRVAVLRHGAAVSPVLDALRAYRNPDGGFGHALEPDVRGPESEPASTLHALEVLLSVGTRDDPMIADAASWIGSIADPDGGVPFVMPTTAAYPHAPWMVPSDGGSHLTFAIAGALWESGCTAPWLLLATDWCWGRLEGPAQLSGYWVKFALAFLDRVPDSARARAAIAGLGSQLDDDGSLPVPGGTEHERLTALTLSERPDGRSRTLFTQAQIDADLELLEQGQQDDGGWTFDWLAWSAGQSVEWRGALTVRALVKLAEHGRLPEARS